MNDNDPLAQLRDIHLPDAISWWPLAPGWWILIALFVSFLLIVCGLFFYRARKRRVITQAQQQFALAAKQTPNKEILVEQLQLFRRVNLKYQPKLNVASLPLSQLALNICQQNFIKISSTSLTLMDNLQYQPDIQVSTTDWQRLMKDLAHLINRLDSAKLKVTNHRA